MSSYNVTMWTCQEEMKPKLEEKTDSCTQRSHLQIIIIQYVFILLTSAWNKLSSWHFLVSLPCLSPLILRHEQNHNVCGNMTCSKVVSLNPECNITCTHSCFTCSKTTLLLIPLSAFAKTILILSVITNKYPYSKWYFIIDLLNWLIPNCKWYTLLQVIICKCTDAKILKNICTS